MLSKVIPKMSEETKTEMPPTEIFITSVLFPHCLMDRCRRNYSAHYNIQASASKMETQFKNNNRSITLMRCLGVAKETETDQTEIQREKKNKKNKVNRGVAVSAVDGQPREG